MNDTQFALDNHLQYQNHLRFPRDLERAYCEDYVSRALEFGCGTGANVIYLAQHGFEMTGVDFATAAVE